MNIEYQEYKKMTDLEQFTQVFSQLVKDKVKTIEYCKLGIITIHFKDGTSCGGMLPWIKCGLVDRNIYNE